MTEHTGNYTLYTPVQRITAAIMIPIYSAGFAAYLAFARPTKAYSQEASALVASQSDVLDSRFNQNSDTLDIVVKGNATVRFASAVPATDSTGNFSATSSYGSAAGATGTVETPAQLALPIQPAPATASSTLETMVNAEAIPAAIDPASAPYITPKKKNTWKTVGKVLAYGTVLYLGYKSLKKNKNSPVSAAPAASVLPPIVPPADGFSALDSGDASDPSLDYSVKGDEDAQDDVSTIKIKTN